MAALRWSVARGRTSRQKDSDQLLPSAAGRGPMLPPRTSTICRLPCPLLCPASLWGGVCRCSAMPTVRAATTRPVVVSLATHPPRLVFTVAATSPRHISHKICCSSRTTPNHACVVSIYSVPVLRSFRRFCILIYIRPAPAPPASKQAGRLARARLRFLLYPNQHHNSHEGYPDRRAVQNNAQEEEDKTSLPPSLLD